MPSDMPSDTPAHPDTLPTPPDPLTPAQARARRAEQRDFIRQEQLAGRLPIPSATPLAPGVPAVTPHARMSGRKPAGKRFEVHELRRIPVTLSERARSLINASSSQGRLFPQALSEAFGSHPDLEAVAVDVVEKARQPGEEEPNLLTGEGLLLAIAVTHASGEEDLHYRWHINGATLAQLHPQTHQPRFAAEQTARTLLQLYHAHEQRTRAARPDLSPDPSL